MSKRKSNILIVDNSQLNRMTLRGFLKDQYNIIETDSGQNAIEIIKERRNIDLIRYGEDEFVLVFQNIEYSDFKNILDRISRHVQEFSINEAQHLSVSIGGIYNITNVNKALDYADQLMYKGKKEHKKVVIEKIKIFK